MDWALVGQGGLLGSPQSSLQLCFEESFSIGLDPGGKTSLWCEQAVVPALCWGCGCLSVYTDISSKSPRALCCPERGVPLNSLIPL